MNIDLIATLLREYRVFFKPLLGTVTIDTDGKITVDKDGLEAFFKSIGYDLEPVIPDAEFWKNIKSLIESVVALSERVKDITPLLGKTLDSIDFPNDVQSLKLTIKELPKDTQGLVDFYGEIKPEIDNIIKGYKALKGYYDTLTDINSDPDLTNAIKRLPVSTLNALTYRYLNIKHNAIMPSLELLGLAEWREQKEYEYNNQVVVMDNVPPRFHLNKVKPLCKDPEDYFNGIYWPNGYGTTIAEVNDSAQKIFPLIQEILESFGAQTHFGLPPSELGIVYPQEINAEMQQRMEGMLTWEIPFYDANSDQLLFFGASLGLLADNSSDKGPGIFILPFGDFSLSKTIKDWLLSLSGAFQNDGFKITKTGIEWVDTSVPQTLNLSITPPQNSKWILGGATRLEVSKPEINAALSLPGSGGPEVDTFLNFSDNQLIINAGNNDFFNSLLDKNKNNSGGDFDLKFGWNQQKKFYIEGNLNLEIFIDFTLFHFLRFYSIKLEFAQQKLQFGVKAGIEFPPSLFQPVNESGDIIPNKKSEITIELTAEINTAGGKGFELTQFPSFSFTKSAILNTGFTLQLDDVKFDFSHTKNIPEANADGRPADFIGVSMEKGVIEFPDFWNHDPNSKGELFVENLLVGTGGVSGTIGLREKTGQTDHTISVRFGEKFKVSLTGFSLKFRQNAILESDITGELDLPGFQDSNGDPAKIEIKIHFGPNGDFEISAKEEDGIDLPLHLDKFLTVSVKSLKIGKRSQKMYVAVAGKISFEDMGGFIGNLLPKDVDIEKLLIWEDGQIELEGGVVTLRKPVKLNLGPVKLTVTALGMGSHERMRDGVLRKYKYVEFSAGISINPGGVDLRGDGIQVFFTVDNDKTKPKYDLDVYVRIQSIAIDLIIPGSASKDQATLLLSGYLSMKEPKGTDPGAGTEYAGGIDFKLPKMKMGGSADMRYNPKVPSFLIDVSLEISTPIILGATGMGIYGFRALFGKRYVVSKTEIGLSEDAEWWQYYKKKVSPQNKEGITASKMANMPGFSFGAGVSLATAADGGQAFSSKVFFLLSLPDVFLLQGQAQILKGRIGLDSETDPPFFALIAIDKTSISAALGVSYKIPEDTGKIMALDALIEMAYFWRDSSAWYLNIGRDLPVDRRVRARIFDLFDVYSYFMLNAKGIRAGAGASLEKVYNYGPVKARLYAYMDTAGRLSFKPLQIGGSIQIGGNVDIKVCGTGLSAYASASLAAEAPKPFMVTGAADACVKVLKKEYCVHFDFTWMFEKNLDFSQVPIIGADLNTVVKALNMMSQEALDVFCIPNGDLSQITPANFGGPRDNVIPIDSFIDIEFRKPVKPVGDASLLRFGGTNPGPNYTDYVAPQRGKSDRVRHDYILNKVEIFSWNPGNGKWEPYHVYDAISPLTQNPFNLTQAEVDKLHFGFWQIDNPGKYTKLRLLAQNPLSFLRQGTGDTIPEDLGTTNGIFCPPPKRKKTCVNFDSLERIPMEVAGNKILQHQRILSRIVSNKGTVINKSYGGVKTALSYNGSDTLELYLPEPMAEVYLLLGTLTNSLTIKYYSRIQTGTDSSSMPVFGYHQVGSVVKSPAQLPDGVCYSNLKTPIDKIEITGNVPDIVERIDAFCDTTISGEAQGFLQIMNMIAANEQLTQMVQLLQDPYRPVVATLPVFSTFAPDLFGNLTYMPGITEPGGALNILFFDGKGTLCEVSLTPERGQYVEWNQPGRWQFRNLRPDPAHTSTFGGNYVFLVDIESPNGTIQTLKGVSKCFPIYYCYNQYLNFFYQICYLNVVDFQYNQNLPTAATVTQHNQSMADAINKTLCPVWRPDTVFAVRVEYTDEVYRESNPETAFNNAFVFGFKTQGPLGHYHVFPTGDGTSDKLKSYTELEGQDKEDTFKLAALKYYIDFPKSYPDPSGNIVNAKPLYYGDPELRLFYIYPHVYQFYQTWATYNGAPKVESSLEVLIKDPTESPFIIDPDNTPQLIPNEVPSAKNEWETNDFPVTTPDIAALNNMFNNGLNTQNPCLPSLKPFRPIGINNLVKPAPTAPLKPLKLYTALYNAVYKTSILTERVKREVHRYAFQTSRYKDFKEHINSYILQRNAQNVIEKVAVYVIEKAFDELTVLAPARDVLAGTLPSTDLLHQEAALLYDKLIDRLFEIKELEPAEFLQFNIIRNSTNGKVLGILLRSPEPFNDPRTPAAELFHPKTPTTNTVQMGTQGFGKVIWDYSTYFSKDNSNAFITNKSLNIPITTKQYFRFKYKLYNGKEYEEKDSENVTLNFGFYLNK